MKYRATKRTQPLRRSAGRRNTQALANARRGRTATGFNPQDANRMAARNFKKRVSRVARRRVVRKPRIRRPRRRKPLRFLGR